ncbi:DUF362 domain-containing protein [Desulfomonile tiedjei]|uniref:DUF362 domain-containing protein n=1 Tax=Desulfomonile tiedjei (strain ATCC 49306 / DSM 6799 / DCB-1) TaxID=706587 RepID=I4C1T7_DESTA|nr:DUF362 domain-containing protein [Desulfomonile tiedjei]AFM23528.1 hypothetical protein Desti_0804 [Desulfomonile tiedjei DSM 6799]
MNKSKVAIVRYETPLASVRRAIDLCHGLDHLPASAKVFIKPNIVYWSKTAPFPKWGVVTTSRVVHDMVVLLKERGIDDISIGEGTVVYFPKDRETAQHAFETLGYNVLKKRYGVKTVDIFAGAFEKVDLGDGVEFNFNADILHSDFVVDIPVLKTHAQTVVSLGIKNIKGVIDMKSRRKCHSADPERNLHFLVSKLANKIPPSVTVLDGIFTNERGPGFDGRMRRSNILVASADMFAADKVGAKILGYEPSDVPHLVYAAAERGRCLDLSDVEVMGETIEDVGLKLEYSFAYNASDTLPAPMEKMGLKGVAYPKYDLSMCTYCSYITGVNLTAIARAWKGEPWDDVEILTGKVMKPTPGKKTILLGRCLYEANKNHPDIDKMIVIKSCPPSPDAVVKALHQVGIQVDPALFENVDAAPGMYMKRYEGKPEFDESLFKVDA